MVACCLPGQEPARRRRLSHCLRVVCPSSNGSSSFQVHVMGRVHLSSWTQPCTCQGPPSPHQASAPPPQRLSGCLAHLPEGPGPGPVADMWARCCTLERTHIQQSRPWGGSECWVTSSTVRELLLAGLGGPLQQESFRGSISGAGSSTPEQEGRAWGFGI